MTGSTAVEKGRRLALAASAGLGVALLLHFELWHCPVAALAGVPCPGCGMTRAAAALFSLDLAGAVELHPLSPLLVPWALGLAVVGVLRHVGGSPAPFAAVRGPVAALLVALLLGVWVSRFFGAFGGPVRVSSHLLD